MTAADFPAPLLPADVDLTGFGYMPLHVEQLKKSRAWLICKRRPDLAFYMLNLWMRAWHERPAASIEDDDDVLADAAGCSPEKWPKIKDDALRGWVRCGDGRLYHPVVAAKAAEAWEERRLFNWRRECDRIRKENRQRADKGLEPLEIPEKPAPISYGKPEVSGGIPAENALKGKVREGKGKGEDTHTPAGAVPTRTMLMPDGWQPTAEDLAGAAKDRPDLPPARLKLETQGFIQHARENRRRFFDLSAVSAGYRRWIIQTKISGGNGNGQGSHAEKPRRIGAGAKAAAGYAAYRQAARGGPDDGDGGEFPE